MWLPTPHLHSNTVNICWGSGGKWKILILNNNPSRLFACCCTIMFCCLTVPLMLNNCAQDKWLRISRRVRRLNRVTQRADMYHTCQSGAHSSARLSRGMGQRKCSGLPPSITLCVKCCKLLFKKKTTDWMVIKFLHEWICLVFPILGPSHLTPPSACRAGKVENWLQVI